MDVDVFHAGPRVTGSLAQPRSLCLRTACSVMLAGFIVRD